MGVFSEDAGELTLSSKERWHCDRTDMGEWGEIKVADLFGQPNCRIPMGNNDWRDQKGSGCGDGTFADAFAFTVVVFL